MARLPRISPVGLPVHIIQRGNNRQVCFVSDEDHGAYAGWLKEYSEKYNVDIHTWVLMTNHVHLLCTPRQEEAVSRMMQALGRRYVRYFNFEYQRSGTLWEGRFKSCLVQEERYLLEVYRYIELNPVRADMVTDPGEYRWPGYQINALGKVSNLCTPHPEYLELGLEPLELNSEMVISCSRSTFTRAGRVKGTAKEVITTITRTSGPLAPTRPEMNGATTPVETPVRSSAPMA